MINLIKINKRYLKDSNNSKSTVTNREKQKDKINNQIVQKAKAHLNKKIKYPNNKSLDQLSLIELKYKILQISKYKKVNKIFIALLRIKLIIKT